MFSLAKELSMTVKELGEKMDARELMEWSAYFLTEDKNQVDRLNQIILNEKGEAYHQSQIRSLFNSLTTIKKSNGTNK